MDGDLSIYYFAVVEISLLIIPIICLNLNYKKKNIKKTIYSLATFGIILYILRLNQITLYGELFELFVPIIIYFLYSYFSYLAINIKNISIRIIVLLIVSIPIAIGYILSTIGIFALVYGMGDNVQRSNVNLGNGYLYRTFNYGGVFDHQSGSKVEIYSLPLSFPIIEKRICVFDLNDSLYKSDNLSVKIFPKYDRLQVKIFSKDSLQIDTLINK